MGVVGLVQCLCDQHQACEGQHGGLLGRRGNWNVLKCFRANHCKHKYALTKWYIYWNDGFSTEWLADFSLSMTNSHFLKPPNHTLKNIYKMAFCLLQNGLSWCPKNDHAFKTKMIKPGKTHKLPTKWHARPHLRPTLPIKWCHIGTPTPPILWRKWQGGWFSHKK